MDRNQISKPKNGKLGKILLQLFLILLIGAVFLLCLTTPGCTDYAALQIPVHNAAPHQGGINDSLSVIDTDPIAVELKDSINSSNAILIDYSSGEVVAKKAPDERIYPASLTKIMTTVIILEHYTDLEQEITMPAEMYSYLIDQNASVAGFLAGERVKVIDLIYGIMLPSGADAAISLACDVAGNEFKFAELMTEKAHEIGAVNTQFVNCTGLHDDGHYSTVRDISIIFRYALKNETFRKVITSESYTTSPTNKHPNGIKLNSTVFSAFNRANLINRFVLGGKTGFTGEARLCLATLAKNHGREYVLVTVGAGLPTTSRGIQHVVDADYIYDKYT